jgi:hypothetical protein
MTSAFGAPSHMSTFWWQTITLQFFAGAHAKPFLSNDFLA